MALHDFGRIQRDARRERRAGLARALHRRQPARKMAEGLAAAELEAGGRAAQLQRLGLDRARRQELKQPLAVGENAAGIVAHVENEAVLRQKLKEAHELLDEAVDVVDLEGAQPKIGEAAMGSANGPRLEHRRHDALVPLDRRMGMPPRREFALRRHDVGLVEKLLALADKIALEVEAERHGGRAVRVVIDRVSLARQGEDQPGKPDFARSAAAAAVFDHDLALLGRQRAEERAEGQPCDAAGAPCRLVAAGTDSAHQHHRAIDRDRIPARHLHARPETRVFETGQQHADDVFPRTTLEAVLDREGEEGDRLVVRARQQVVRVEIAERHEDFRHLVMEREIARQVSQVEGQELEPTHRIDAVHRPLHRQMRVKVLEQQDGLLDDPPALGEGERLGPREEMLEPDGSAKMRLDRIVEAGEEGCRERAFARPAPLLASPLRGAPSECRGVRRRHRVSSRQKRPRSVVPAQPLPSRRRRIFLCLARDFKVSSRKSAPFFRAPRGASVGANKA